MRQKARITEIDKLPLFLTVSEVADILCYNRQTVGRLIRSGTIRAIRDPNTQGRWRVPKAEIIRLYEGGENNEIQR